MMVEINVNLTNEKDYYSNDKLLFKKTMISLDQMGKGETGLKMKYEFTRQLPTPSPLPFLSSLLFYFSLYYLFHHSNGE